METIFSQPAVNIRYDGKSMLLRAEWTSESLKISEDFFKNINRKYIEIAEKKPVKSFYIDTKDFQYTIRPEIQEWVASEVLPRLIGLGLRKVAFLQSEDFVAQLSVEQTMSECDDLPFQVIYFSNEGDALAWLNRGN
jgi:hypothetical protein